MVRGAAVLPLAAACLLAGCQGEAAPEGVRMYDSQKLALDLCTVSVETTAATANEAAASCGLSGGTVDRELPPEGYERLTIVAKFENTSSSDLMTTAGDSGTVRVLATTGDSFHLVTASALVRGVSDEPTPVDGRWNLAPEGSAVVVASWFVPEDQPQLLFDWMIGPGDYVTIELSPSP